MRDSRSSWKRRIQATSGARLRRRYSVRMDECVRDQVVLPRSRSTISMSSKTAAFIAFASQQAAAQVGEQLREVGGEARRRGAVDDAVVVAQAQRQQQPRLERLAVPHRLDRGLRYTEDGHF